MKPVRKHFVVFLSPGTFFSETTEKPIRSWSPRLAAKLARSIRERHGATPYGFYFTTCIVAASLDDGEGGTLEVLPKQVDRSAMFFLTGRVRTLVEIEAKADPSESILLSNMKGNGWAACVENTNSWKVVQPFERRDKVIDWNGKLVYRGSDYYGDHTG